MDSEEEINLPEDDSVFMDISNRPDQSVDVILEDSFSDFSKEAVETITSTPSVSQRLSRPGTSGSSLQSELTTSRSRGRARRGSPASLSPGAGCHGSPSRRSKRKALEDSPEPPSDGPSCNDSPSSRTRSQTRNRQASPGPSSTSTTSHDSPSTRTRSRTRQASPGLSASPSTRTRSGTRQVRPEPASTVPSCPASPSSSTRSRTRSATVAASPSSASANPSKRRLIGSQARPGSSNTTKMRCPKCPSELANKKTLDVHLRGHLMKDIVSKAPSHAQLQQEMPNLMNAVLIELLLEPVIGDLSQLCHDFYKDFQNSIICDVTGAVTELCEYLATVFDEILKQNRALFPSSIRTSMYVGSNRILSSCDFIDALKGHITALCDPANCDGGVVNVFIGDFVMSLTKKIIIYAIRTMRGVCTLGDSEIRKKRSSDRIDDKEFQQLVYHIGGSVISAFLWKGIEYSKTSQTWTNFCEVLKSRFSRNKEKTNECSAEVRGHTDKTDRGGLKHCSDSAFDFFLIFFDYLMSLEAQDGTLPDDVIDNYVLQHDMIVCLWDELVGDNLSEVESLDLLIQITARCVRVTMKGIMKRRINKAMKKAFASVGLRSKLAK